MSELHSSYQKGFTSFTKGNEVNNGQVMFSLMNVFVNESGP